ncbi:hypothetical protein APR41_02120 [Salegentibacter salinarum]|uniref:Uncharacterized protein n=1 Tax=Salegentibacter salinarum TaxID=447422 RepID=A0A2N0U463_9FLAO|nr:hypothetical protein [Salegentibacter salinarum]PKD21797.1 hypothetical protein APR41_02120 [Salegentibacter salinarum]SKB33486.1 hypothetical protein SAMN05660903_00135 [Salegentibacter salinarum]
MKYNDTYFPKTSMFKKEILERGEEYFRLRYNIIDVTDFINLSFQDEYSYYLKNKEYFAGCALKTYKGLYNSRLKTFEENYPYADEFDFIRKELTIIKRIGFHEEYYNFFNDLYRKPYKYNFRLSSELTREFLFSKVLKDLGGSLELGEKYYEIYLLPDTADELKETAFWNFLPKRPKTDDESIQDENVNSRKSNNINLSALETAYLAHYFVESKEYKFINGTPGKGDWEHFSNITSGASSTNIRKYYSENLKPVNRLKPSRIAKIKKVISYLKAHFPNYQRSLQEAEQELQVMQQELY